MTEPGPWAVRVTWLLLPVVAGASLADALSTTSAPVRTVAAVLAWAAWTAGLVSSLVPRTVSLTVVRIVAPAGVALAAWAAAAAPEGTSATASGAALVWALLAAGAAFSPLTGDAFVNGSAYGPERRMALRVPGALLVLAPISWLVVVAGAISGPLLLAARSWALGGVALVVGVPAAVVAARALHGLARRWVVFVPAGVVLHDLFTLSDAVLFPRRMVRSLGPAPVDAAGTALDATGRAPGLALLLEITEALPIGVRRGRDQLANLDADRILFTPTRPGELLAEAARRRLPVAPAPARA